MSRSNQLAGLLTADPPSALDTINEINTALGNDASLSTTLTNSIALKAPIASPTFTGDAVFDTDTLKVDATNNRVGIGTSSPLKNTHWEIAQGTADGTEGVMLGLVRNTASNSNSMPLFLQHGWSSGGTTINSYDTWAVQASGADSSGADLVISSQTGSAEDADIDSFTERMRIDSSGRLSTPNGSQLSSVAGTTYTLYSSDAYRQLDSNGYQFRTMRKVAVSRSGSITVTWDGYVESGQYYWSYRFKINGSAGTTYFYTQNRSTSAGVHAWNSYSLNLNVNHGDTVDLEFTTANGGGTPQTGTGQDLFIRNFRIKATTPESILGLV